MDHEKIEYEENLAKLKTSIFKLIGILTCSMIIEYSSYNDNKFVTMSKNIFHLIGGTFLTASLMNTPIVDFSKAIRPFLPNIFNKGNNLNKCKIKYNYLKNNIPKDVQEAIERAIKNAELKFEQYNKHDDDEKSKGKFLEECSRIDYILTLFQKTEQKCLKLDEIVDKIDKFLENREIKDELIQKVIIPYVYNMMNEEKHDLSPIYLLGASGIGKTKFVNDLAKVLDVPLIIGNMNNNRNQRYEDDEKFSISYLDQYTRALYESTTKHNSKTCILFLDEFDKKIDKYNTNLLNSLNAGKSIYDGELGIDVNIQNILLICAGNRRITAVHKHLQALENRFIIVKFPKMSENLKKEISMKHVMENIDITKVNINKLNELISNDKNHGVRQLLMELNIFIHNCLSKEMFKNTRWHKLLEDEENEIVGNCSVEENEENASVEEKENVNVRRRARSKSPFVKA